MQISGCVISSRSCKPFQGANGRRFLEAHEGKKPVQMKTKLSEVVLEKESRLQTGSSAPTWNLSLPGMTPHAQRETQSCQQQLSVDCMA